MPFKGHKPPPIPPQVHTPLPEPDPVALAQGILQWPSIFYYTWSVWSLTPSNRLESIAIESSYRPPLDEIPAAIKEHPDAPISVIGNRMSGADAQRRRTWPYSVTILDGCLAEFEALVRAGLLQDPRHTGYPYSETIDERKAPGA